MSDNEFQPLVDTLREYQEKIEDFRLKNQGRVPLPVFVELIKIQGMYQAVELHVKGAEPETYWLKKRNAQLEDGWAGQYHIIGSVVSPMDNSSSTLERVLSELPLKSVAIDRTTPALHTVFYDEFHRRSRVHSREFFITLTNEEESELSDYWKKFSLNDIETLHNKLLAGEQDFEVIDFHVAMIMTLHEHTILPGHLFDLQKHYPYLSRLFA